MDLFRNIGWMLTAAAILPLGCNRDGDRNHEPGAFHGRLASVDPNTRMVHTYQGVDVEIHEYMTSAEKACLAGNPDGCRSLAWLYDGVGGTSENPLGRDSGALVRRDEKKAQHWRKHACEKLMSADSCYDYAFRLDSQVENLRYMSISCQYGYGGGCLWMARSLLDTNHVDAKELFQRACHLDGFSCREFVYYMGDDLDESEYRAALKSGCAIEPEIKALSMCREVLEALVDGTHGYRKDVHRALEVAQYVCETLNWSGVCELGADIMITQEHRYVNARDVALAWYEKGCRMLGPEACLKLAQLRPEVAAWAVDQAISDLEQSCRTDASACFRLSRIYAELPDYLPGAIPDTNKSVYFLQIACEGGGVQCL